MYVAHNFFAFVLSSDVQYWHHHCHTYLCAVIVKYDILNEIPIMKTDEN